MTIYIQHYRSAFTGDDVFDRLPKPPVFIAAHRVHGSRERNGETETTWIEPDRVLGTEHCRFAVKRGVVASIHASDDANVAAVFAEFDAERARLNGLLRELRIRERKAVIGTFDCSKPLKVVDIPPAVREGGGA